jgi:hypothetical protein
VAVSTFHTTICDFCQRTLHENEIRTAVCLSQNHPGTIQLKFSIGFDACPECIMKLVDTTAGVVRTELEKHAPAQFKKTDDDSVTPDEVQRP